MACLDFDDFAETGALTERGRPCPQKRAEHAQLSFALMRATVPALHLGA